MNYSKLIEKIQSDLFTTDEGGMSWPVVCELHDAFKQSEFLEDGENAEDKHHNCLGCNFAKYTWGLLRNIQAWECFTKANPNDVDAEDQDFYPVASMFNWLNTLVDAYCDVLAIIQLGDERRVRLFPVFGRIRSWANFFKHPKAMILTHHAQFVFSTTQTGEGVLREGDIQKYYRDHKEDAKLFNRLTNKTDVIIVLPDLEALIADFAQANQAFIDLVTNNALFRDELGKKSTYKNYYEELEEKDEPNK
jgi:hypothetical protein